MFCVVVLCFLLISFLFFRCCFFVNLSSSVGCKCCCFCLFVILFCFWSWCCRVFGVRCFVVFLSDCNSLSSVFVFGFCFSLPLVRFWFAMLHWCCFFLLVLRSIFDLSGFYFVSSVLIICPAYNVSLVLCVAFSMYLIVSVLLLVLSCRFLFLFFCSFVLCFWVFMFVCVLVFGWSFFLKTRQWLKEFDVVVLGHITGDIKGPWGGPRWPIRCTDAMKEDSESMCEGHTCGRPS